MVTIKSQKRKAPGEQDTNFLPPSFVQNPQGGQYDPGPPRTTTTIDVQPDGSVIRDGVRLTAAQEKEYERAQQNPFSQRSSTVQNLVIEQKQKQADFEQTERMRKFIKSMSEKQKFEALYNEIVGVQQNANLLSRQKDAAQNPAVQQALMQLNAPIQTPQADVEDPFSLGGVIKDVGTNILTKAGAGAAGGALAGSAVPVVGTAGGAVVGGIGGAIAGAFTFMSEIKEDALQSVKVEFTDFKESRKNFKGILLEAKEGDPLLAVELFTRELEKVYQHEVNMKALDEDKWLTKASEELVIIENFKRITEPQLRRAMADAIAKNPNPYNFDLSNLASDEVTVE